MPSTGLAQSNHTESRRWSCCSSGCRWHVVVREPDGATLCRSSLSCTRHINPLFWRVLSCLLTGCAFKSSLGKMHTDTLPELCLGVSGGVSSGISLTAIANLIQIFAMATFHKVTWVRPLWPCWRLGDPGTLAFSGPPPNEQWAHVGTRRGKREYKIIGVWMQFRCVRSVWRTEHECKLFHCMSSYYNTYTILNISKRFDGVCAAV